MRLSMDKPLTESGLRVFGGATVARTASVTPRTVHPLFIQTRAQACAESPLEALILRAGMGWDVMERDRASLKGRGGQGLTFLGYGGAWNRTWCLDLTRRLRRC